MSNKTKINPEIEHEIPITVINPEAVKDTVVNPYIEDEEAELGVGTLLSGKYRITSVLSLSTGEADLYVCSYDDKEYVAKIYRRRHAVKPQIISALKAIDSPYVARLYDTGVINERTYEILPYYKNGSLQGRKFTLEELKESIIPCINEALHVLHENDIIHKDLKPANIMLLDDNRSVAIIDFGISSVVEDGATVLITKTGMTPEYSAPETFKSLFLEESDYYSFGISIYELFWGYTPYNNMSAEQIVRLTTVQRIPFPENAPEELKDLISAVTYFDITNRNAKKNPNRRWTYNEVKKWCEGKRQVIPGEGSGIYPEKSIPPYTFLGKQYKDIPTLVTALATKWNDGKQQLYKGLLTAFFRSFDPELAQHCADAEEEASQGAGRDDIIFHNLLYKLDPDLNGFYWMGKIYESLPALGRDMLERLWQKNRSRRAFWDSILTGRLLSEHLKSVRSENEELWEAVEALEVAHSMPDRSRRDVQLDYYLMAYLLSGQRLLNIEGRMLKSVHELTAYMRELLETSYADFERFCHRMIDYNDTLDVQLEAWLIALGKRSELDLWRRQMRLLP